MNNQEYISGKEATKILGVQRHTLYKYDREGLIKTIRSPGGKSSGGAAACKNDTKDGGERETREGVWKVRGDRT